MRSIFSEILERLSRKKRQDDFSGFSRENGRIIIDGSLEEKIADQITSIGHGSKTSLPGFIKIHNNLRSRYSWYHKWHENPASHLVHWIVLTVVLVLVTLLMLVTVFGSHTGKIKAASKQTWDNATSWKSWTLDGVTVDQNGSISLASNFPNTIYIENGTASYQFTPVSGETVDWLSTNTISDPLGQTIKEEFSTDNIIYSDDIATLADSQTVYVRLTLGTADATVTPKISSLEINYSRLPNTPTGLNFFLSKKILTTSQNLQAGAFSDPDGDQHQSTQWQVTSKSGDYSNPVFDSGMVADQRDLPTFKLPENLKDGQYFFRVRYQDSTGAWSLWSSECGFAVSPNNQISVNGDKPVLSNPKELVEKRTETTKTMKNDDGTLTLDSYAGTIHYKENYADSNAQWKDINPNHSVDTPEYVLFDEMPSTVKVFKDKIGYEIESRKTGEKYDVVLQDLDGNPKLSMGKSQDGKISWADINPAQAGNSKLETLNSKLSEWILPEALASDSQVTKDEGNVKFEFEITQTGVRLWKTITGPDAPKNFKWKITKTGSGNTLKFRDKPDAYDLNPDGSVELKAKVPIEAKKISTDATGFVWQETAPGTDMKIDTDVIYYPGSDYDYSGGRTTMDGWISAENGSYSAYDWATITNQYQTYGNTDTYNSFSDHIAGWEGYGGGGCECGGSDGFANNYRSMYLFDTSTIPDAGTVSAATFSVYGYSKADAHSWAPSLNVYSSTPSSNTYMSSSDYPNFGTTALSSAITYANFSTSGYNDFAISPTSTVIKNGITKLALRTTNDATGSSPTIYADGNAYFGGYFAESGASTSPKLSVTYSGGATISGTIYTNTAKSGNVGAGVTVAISSNGGAKRTVTTTSGGAFSFAGVEVAAGQPVTIFTDDSGSYPHTNLVTIPADSSSDITGLEMFTEFVVLRHEGATVMSNTILDTADNCGDSDIVFSNSSGAETFSYGLYIPANMTYTPGGAVTVAGSYSGDFVLYGTVNMGTSAYSSSSGNTFIKGGTFNAGSGTNSFAYFQMSGGTFNSNTGSDTFYDFTLTGGTFNSNTATVYFSSYSYGISMTGGTFNAPAGTLSVYTGSFDLGASNTFNANNGTVEFTSSCPSTFTTGTKHLYNLKFSCSGSSYSTTSTTTYIDGTLTIPVSGYFAPSGNLSVGNFVQSGGDFYAPDMTVSGNWTHSGGNFYHQNYSTYSNTSVTFTGNATFTGDTTFYNFTADTAGKTLTFAANSTQTVEGLWDVMGSATGTTSLVSGTPGTYWHINPTGTVQIANASGYVNVSDSYNDNASPISTLNTGTSANITRVSHDFNWADASSTCTWDGGGADNNWSTAANWSGDTVPSDICDVIFDSTSTKASTIDTGFTNHIKSLSVNSGYTNTVSGSADLIVDGSVNLAAGTFAPGSQTISVGGNWNNTGGTFTKGTSTISMNGSGQSGTINTNGTGTGKDFYNLTVAGASYSAFDSYTSLLLHGDGSDSSTTITDSAKSHTMTPHGSAQIKTAQSKFGGASIYFTGGSGDYIGTTASTDFDFGDGDFTIDGWVRFPSLPANQESSSGYQMIAMDSTDGNNRWALYLDNRPSQGSKRGFRFDVGVSGDWSTLVDAGDIASLSANTWYHLAVVRYGNSWKMYRNGSQTASATYTTTLPHYTGDLELGTEISAGGAANSFYLDEFRVSKGVARWTSAFTSPSSAYAADTYTGIYSCSADAVASNNLTISSGTLDCGSNNITAGNYIQSGGIYTAPGSAKSFTVNGGWNHSGGTFTHNSGTVTLAGDALIQGDTTFNNLTATTGDKTLSFAALSSQTVAGTWTVTGTLNHNVVLARSGGSGNDQWNITPTSSSVNYVTVSNSYNHGTTISPAVATDSGNNTGWSISGGVVAPTVTTQSPSSVTTTAATGNGNITATGGANATVRGFEYKADVSAGHDCTGDLTSPSTSYDSGDYSTGAYTKGMSSLSVSTYYCTRAYATNSAGTGYGSWVSFDTLANTPSAPTVDTATVSSLKITINQNSNPSTTEYAISCNSSDSTFLNYTTNACEAIADDSNHWRTYANWGGASGFVDTGLTSNTSYTYKVEARNGDKTATSLSSGATLSTSANPPSAASGVSVGTLGATTFTVGWTDNSSNETGFKVYVSTTANADCSAATYPGSPDYTASAGATSQAYTGKSVNTQYCAKVIATNADGDASAAYSSPVYTLANTPSAPTLGTPTTAALPITINTNSNPASTTYSIKIVYGATTKYVATNGTLQDSAAWDTYTNFGGASGVTATSLSANTQYTVSVAAKNGDGTATSYSSTAAKYTLIGAPSAPTLSAVSNSSINITLTDNGATTYAIAVSSDGGSSWNYVKQSDHTTQVSEDWQNYAAWGSGSGFANNSLSTNVQYTYKVKARNGDNVESAFSSTATKYTLANVPSAPTVDTATISSLKVTINENSNPSNTTYAIKVVYSGTTKYLATNGTLGDAAVFDTYTNFGGSSGKVMTGLTSNTSYTVSVAAKNGDAAATSYSSTSALSTSANPPTAASAVSIGTLGTTTFTISWTDNSSNETGFKVYASTTANADCSLATYPGSPDYTASAGATSQAYTGKSVNTQYCAKVIATNADGDASAAYSSPVYTLATVPAFTLPSSTTTTIKIKITSDNSSSYAVQRSIDHLDWKYVKESDGTLTAPDAADWQNLAAWNNLDNGGTDVVGLTSGVTYYFRVVARNAENVVTDFSDYSSLATASSISISGHVYTNDAKTTNIGANKTVAVSVNGAAIGGTAETDSNGAFTITNIVVGANEPLAVFVDESGIEANLFTLAVNGSTNITGLELYVNKIIVRSESATAISNANIKSLLACSTTYDCGSNLHLSNPSASKINFDEGYDFQVDTGTTYTPGAEIGTIGNLRVKGTLALGANSLTVTGDLNATGGTITQSGSTVNFTNTTGTQTITSAGQHFGNVAFTNGATKTITDSMSVDGTFIQSGGTVNFSPSVTMTVNGTFSQVTGSLDLSNNPNLVLKDDVTINSGATVVKGTTGTTTLAGDLTYYSPTNNIGKVAIGASPDTVTLSADTEYDSLIINTGDTLITAGYDITVHGDLDIVGTLNATSGAGGDSTIHVSGNWTNSGTFTRGASSVDLNGADSATQVISGNTTFNNLTASTLVSNTLGRTIQFAGSSTTTVAGTLTVTGDTGKILTLERKTGDSGSWTINPTAATVDYASVTRSINTGVAFCATHSTGSNNTGWYFSDGSECTNTIQFSSTSSSGLESVTSVNIPVSLLSAQPTDASIDYAVTAVGAGTHATGGGVDYTLASGTATITSGNTSTNIALTIVNDTLDEPDEIVEVTLSNPINCSLGTTQVFTYTILDNDNPPTVAFDSATGNGSESTTSVNLPVSLSTASGKTITVDYAVTGGTATGSGTDYTLASGTLTFSPGDTTKNIPMTVVNDLLDENNETVIVTLSNPSNATLGTNTSETYTINDNDNAPMVTLELSGSPLEENGGVATLTARLDAVSGLPVTVNLSYSGTATNIIDYTRSASIVVPAGSTTASISLTGVDDYIVDPNETIIVDISSVTNGTETDVQQVTATITDDDVLPTVTAGTVATYTDVTATIPCNITAIGSLNPTIRGIKYSSTGETDDLDSHTTGSYSIGAYSVNLTSLSANTLYHFRSYATNAVGTSYSAWTTFRTLASNPVAPTVTAASVSSINVKIANNGSEVYAVAIYEGATQIGWINQSMATIQDDPDWKAFSNWDNSSTGVTVTGLKAGTEYRFRVIAQNSAIPAQTTSLDSSGIATVSTQTNTVSLSASSPSAIENGGASIVTATLANPVSNETVVTLGFGGTAVRGADYNTSSTTITIPAWGTTGTATLTAISDTLYEINESIVVSVASATYATAGSAATVTITDDDNPPMVSLEISGANMSENSGQVSVTARLDAVSGRDVAVALKFSGTAVRSTDYTASDTTINIGAGTTSNSITLATIDNHLVNGNKTVVVEIDSVVNATEIGDQLVSVEIIEDDTAPAITAVPTGILMINNGATKTTSASVRLTINSLTATEMKISNNLSFAGANWETYRTVKDWTVANGTVDGPKTVYLKFRDLNGTESEIVYASILLESALPVDTIAPAAPSGLSVSVNSTSITLNWTNPTDADFIKVLIFRGTAEGFGTDSGSNLLATTTSTETQSYTDTSATSGVLYFYKIKAVDTTGNLSVLSNEVSAMLTGTPEASPLETTKTKINRVIQNIGSSIVDSNETIAKALHVSEKSVPIATAAAAGFSAVVAAFLAAPNPGTNGAASLVLTFILTGSIRRKRNEDGTIIMNPMVEKILEIFSTLLILFGTISIISGLVRDPHNIAYIVLALAYPYMWYEDIKAIVHGFRVRLRAKRGY